MSNDFHSGSTVPCTPKHFADEIEEDGDSTFALFCPITENARDGFDATVNAVIQNTPIFDHFKQFLRYGEKRVKRARSVHSGEQSDEVSEPEQWMGEFKLSLDISPNDPQSWWLGSQCLPEETDLLLTPGNGVKGLRIAHKHARLFLHPETYRLVILAWHSVTIGRTGSTLQTLTRNDQRILEDGDVIMIGPLCTYSFRYTNFYRTALFTDSLQQYRKRVFGYKALNRHLTPGSVGKPILLGEYFCSPAAFAEGTFGTVSAGWNQEGKAVAIKRFKDPQKDEISSHKEMMKYIRGHENILQLIECIGYSKSSVPNAYFVYSPLATVVIKDIIPTHQVGINTRIALLSDYLCGLAFLHEKKGVMHLDISPGNLAITSLEDPKGIIIDLDAAVKSEFCSDHSKGTLPYMAPEIIRLRINRSNQPFEKSVDIWALGICMFDLSQGEFIWWGRENRVSQDRYEKFLEKIGKMQSRAESNFEVDFCDWIEAMTAFRPENRKTAGALYSQVSDVAKKMDRGSIVLQRIAKRPREE